MTPFIRTSTPLLALFAAFSFASGALAESASLSFLVSQAPGAAPTCALLGTPPAATDGPLAIEVSTNIAGATLATPYTYSNIHSAAPAGNLTLDQASSTGSTPKLGAPDEDFALTVTVNLPSAGGAAPVATPVPCVGRMPPREKTSPAVAADDEKAQQWWEGNSEYATNLFELIRKAQGIDQKVQLLVYLPSGRVAPPQLRAQTEGTLFQAVQIRQSGTPTVDLEVTACPNMSEFRIKGTENGGTGVAANAADAKTNASPQVDVEALQPAVDEALRDSASSGLVKADQTELQNISTTSDPATVGKAKKVLDKLIKYVSGKDKYATQARVASALQLRLLNRDGLTVVPVGQIFTCGAGDMRFSLTYGGREKRTTETVVQLRPKYNLAVIAALGWDSATTNRYELNSTTTPGTITRSKERVGTSLYAGATWMMGGVDYGNLRWYNYFANPFVAVNVIAPLEDAVVGTVITPTGGVGIAVGLSLHKQTTLAKGYKEKGEFDGAGDIPVRKTWSGISPGLFIGFSVDMNVYQAISGAVSKQK